MKEALEEKYQMKTTVCSGVIVLVVIFIGSYNSYNIYHSGFSLLDGMDILTVLPLFIAISIRFYKAPQYIFEQNWE